MKKKINTAAGVKAPATKKAKAQPAKSQPEGSRAGGAQKAKKPKSEDAKPKKVTISKSWPKKKRPVKSSGDPRTNERGHMDLRENEKLVQAIETTILAGTSVSGTCGRCGISRETFYRWMKEGEAAPEGTLAREIYDRFTRARAEAEHRNLLLIQRAAAGDAKTKTPADWRAAAWFLERSFPKEYGVRRIEVSGPDAGPVQTQNQSNVVHYNAPMNDDEMEAALEKIISSRKKHKTRKTTK